MLQISQISLGQKYLYSLELLGGKKPGTSKGPHIESVKKPMMLKQSQRLELQ